MRNQQKKHVVTQNLCLLKYTHIFFPVDIFVMIILLKALDIIYTEPYLRLHDGEQ